MSELINRNWKAGTDWILLTIAAKVLRHCTEDGALIMKAALQISMACIEAISLARMLYEVVIR